MMFTVLLLFLAGPAAGETPDYDGHRQLVTDHFTFIHEARDEWAAQEIAGYADEVLGKLSRLLSHTPKGRIPVIITSRPAHANGYYSPLPPKIVLFITSSENRFLGSRTADWLRSLFTHELTHYIHLTAPIGPAKVLTPIFGPEVPAMNSLLVPGWWIEGITTYAESTYAEGGRGDSRRFALTYEAPIGERTMWSLAKGAYGSAFPPSGRIYTTGYLMVDHLIDTYGEDTFAEINRRFAAWPFFGMDRPFKKTIGKSAKDVYAEAVGRIAAALSDDVAAHPLFSEPRIADYQLPFPTARGLFGSVRTLDEGSSLVRFDAEGNAHAVVSRLPLSASHPASFTEDGRKAYLAHLWVDPYHRSSTELAPVGYSDLYRVDLENESVVRLTEKARLTHPAASPDGNRLVAIEPVDTRYRLVEIDQETNTQRILLDVPGGSLYEPQFSPDGGRIVAIEVVAGKSTLVLIEEGKEPRRLWPHDAYELHNPRFISDREIWFASDRDGRLALYGYDMESQGISRLLTDPIGILGATVHDDRVIYSTYTSLGHALRSVPRSSLTGIPVPFGKTEKEDPDRPVPQGTLPTRPYHDLPRFNLWLPLPLETSTMIAPGASVIMSSNLGRHALALSGAWVIERQAVQAALVHAYAHGPLSLETRASADFGLREYSLFSDAAVPLWTSSTLAGNRMLAIGAVLGATFEPEAITGTAFGYLAYGYASPSAPKDQFGRFRYSATGSFQYDRDFYSGARRTIPIISLAGQVPLGKTHQALVLQLDTAWHRGKILTPSLLDLQQKVGDAKSLATLRWHIPLGLLDVPIPHGGLVGLALSFHAQSAVYLDAGILDWEEDVYLGATILADVALGAAFTLRPQLSVEYSVTTNQCKIFLGMGIDTLFTGRGDLMHVPVLHD